MKKSKIIVAIVLALVTFMTALTLSAQRFQPIDGLVVFGDSLSDTGRVFRATSGLYPPDPPYFQGRYSNGRVWVEYLAERLNLSTSQVRNFACGGATSGSASDNFAQGLVPGLLSQVQSLIQAQPRLDAAVLYVVWAGANDYLQGANNAAPTVSNVRESIDSLISAGATRILVANLPNLGELPATRNSTNSANLTTLSQMHNQGLRRSLKVLGQRHSNLDMMLLDVNALYQDAIIHPSKFGFTNVTGACVSGTTACSAPQQFLFWDGIHPTTATHEILGERAFGAIEAQLLLSAGV
jgi:phospholipase/lecithinase/hemolysin